MAKGTVFFSGIGGSGMSSLACHAAGKGMPIGGSDRAFDLNPSHPLISILEARGITLCPQDGSGIAPGISRLVISAAVEPDQPEPLKARELGIPVIRRADYLAELAASHRTVAIAGTSGKSTTSGMLAFLMERLAMSPGFIGGGRVRAFRKPDLPGNVLAGDSDILVIEACESDESIVNYSPEVTVLLNLDLDHHSIADTAGLFRSLIANTRRLVIFNADDRRIMELAPKDALCFSTGSAGSTGSKATLRAENIMLEPFGSRFSVEGTEFHLLVPGIYNISNAMASLAALRVMGADIRDAGSVLHEFQGIERRFEVHLNELLTGGRLVVDDYAHNPHKIAALMQAMKAAARSVCYIFQPHGFGPTRLMREGYIEAFSAGMRAADSLIVLPIYYAGGTVQKDISSADIALHVRGNAIALERREEVFSHLDESEAFVVMGARDDSLSDLAEAIAGRLRHMPS